MKIIKQENKKETEAEAEKLVKTVKKSEKSVRKYQFLLLRLIAFILVVWILFFKIIGIIRMPSDDMFPRIDAGDMLMFYRLEKNIKSQDVVVIEKETPGKNKKEIFVCRVIAAGGDTFEIDETERPIVNGNRVSERSIFYSTPAYEEYTTYPIKLNDGEYFVLADNRNGGADSRFFGVVKQDEILGTVITVLRRNNI